MTENVSDPTATIAVLAPFQFGNEFGQFPQAPLRQAPMEISTA